MYIYITQQITVCLIIILSIHVYVLEIGQRLVSRYRAPTTNISLTSIKFLEGAVGINSIY